ncbi:hypothetical protein FB566_3105 [Stackebrandtia endophytica]|uniref:Uncharacterized protein n=1 Tax=Stackebrandtia endophytica TaxID=1496996 RepID=A0A543AYA2_9ACTN|nr:hypothetical protein [Stackebrandtia endophytica]TQL77546.1 hypothetical protein FB566_3105 [Stackebrandtia endophytica]
MDEHQETEPQPDTTSPKGTWTWWKVGFGAVVALAVVVAGTVWLWPGADEDTVEPQLEPVDVQVVDSGFSIYENDDVYWEGSVGYILENTSNQVALAQVEFWFTDDSGDRLDERRPFVSRPAYIFPGESVGGGTTGWMGKVGLAVDPPNITGVEFEVTAEGVGWPQDHEQSTIDTDFLTREEAVFVHEYETKDALSVDLNSHYDDPQRIRALGIVFRNDTGDIIGGWGTFRYWQYRDSEEIPENGPEVRETPVPTGTSTTTIEALVPPEVDDSLTEIYAYPYLVRDETDLRESWAGLP